MPTVNLFSLIRPFLWVAAFAFLAGFSGYLLVDAGGAARAYGQMHAASIAALGTGPAKNI